MHQSPNRQRLHDIIFGAETPMGKAFDVALIIAIVLSVCAVMLESIAHIAQQYGHILRLAEWIFTILFTIEYGLRIYAVVQPRKYIFSFFGLVDLLAILPTYLSLIFPGTQYMLVIRLLRILRVFRVLKLVQFLEEAQMLKQALRASGRKITVFMFTVITLVVIVGSLMYLIEGAENGFTSIPRSIYWAIVTLTTVGYGDISPHTNLGQLLASIVMIMGYAIIAVPTGIVTVELTRAERESMQSTRSCSTCASSKHAPDAIFCKYCGDRL
ncbi:MAG: ion transporter [Rhodothermales bacterium]